MVHHNYRNIDKLEEKMKSHQNINYALVGGMVTSIMAAFLWAFVTIGSGYQIGLMAIVVGLIVGIGVRYFGAGYDPIYSLIGGGFTLFSCLLGNLLSQIGFYMSEESLGFMQTISFLDFGTIISIIMESFTLMDLLFYGIAIYEGVRFSRRMIEPNTDPNDSLAPPLSDLRGPLVGTISICLVGMFVYQVMQGPSEYTYFHETGEKMSVGAYSGGVEDGEWEYFYTNGQIESKGGYEKGKKVGEWATYYDNGQLESKVNYINGLESGEVVAYFETGNVAAETVYKNGRLNGATKVFYENGNLANQGEYVNDREQGAWIYHYENGNKSATGRLDQGEYKGIWHYYQEDGALSQILEHETTEDFKIIEAYDLDGDLVVKDGKGKFTYYHENGVISSSGIVKEGVQFGDWTSYDDEGNRTEEGYYEDGVYRIKNSWNSKGQHIKNSNGNYKTYSKETGNLIESGQIAEGLRSGLWTFYYDSLQIPLVVSNFVNGKMEGELTRYSEAGEVLQKSVYKNGKEHGLTVWYNEFGTKISEVNFEDGLKEGVQLFWNGAGVMTKQEIYEKGQLIETK